MRPSRNILLRNRCWTSGVLLASYEYSEARLWLRCKNPERRVFVATKFCTPAPNVLWNLLHVTLPNPEFGGGL